MDPTASGPISSFRAPYARQLWERRAAKDPKVLETLRRWYPLGRVVEPTDVAKAVGFLASDAASAITGVALPVDCGLMSGNLVMRQELTLEDL